MKKECSIRNGKKAFLLGKKDGRKVWLIEGKWDCEWYWAIGYLQTFRGNDIDSHQHWDSLFFNNRVCSYDLVKEYFDELTVSDKELWTLCELMRSLYTARRYSDMLYTGGAHLTQNPCADIIKDNTEYERINKVVIPAMLKEVYKLLTTESIQKEFNI